MKKILSLLFTGLLISGECSENICGSSLNAAQQIVASNIGYIDRFKDSLDKITAKELIIGSFALLGAYHFRYYTMPVVQKQIERALNIFDKTDYIRKIEFKLNAQNALQNWHLSDYQTAVDIKEHSSDIIDLMNRETFSGWPVRGRFVVHSNADGHLRDSINSLQKILPKYHKRIYFRVEEYSIDDLITEIAQSLGFYIDEPTDYRSITNSQFKALESNLLTKSECKWNELQKRIIRVYLNARMKEARLAELCDVARGPLERQPARIRESVNRR